MWESRNMSKDLHGMKLSPVSKEGASRLSHQLAQHGTEGQRDGSNSYSSQISENGLRLLTSRLF